MFTRSYSTEQQAYSNLVNLLLTRRGERYLHPDFGTNIIDSLFMPNIESVRGSIRESVTDSIARWLPYITLLSVSVTTPETDSDIAQNSASQSNLEHIIYIELVYSVSDTDSETSIKLGVGPSGNIGVINE